MLVNNSGLGGEAALTCLHVGEQNPDALTVAYPLCMAAIRLPLFSVNNSTLCFFIIADCFLVKVAIHFPTIFICIIFFPAFKM